jgi:energy-converting hydrogenase Eha subunit A
VEASGARALPIGRPIVRPAPDRFSHTVATFVSPVVEMGVTVEEPLFGRLPVVQTGSVSGFRAHLTPEGKATLIVGA